jgi:hypothetical protein
MGDVTEARCALRCASALAIVFAMILGSGCNGGTATSCNTSSDCPSSQICTGGMCVPTGNDAGDAGPDVVGPDATDAQDSPVPIDAMDVSTDAPPDDGFIPPVRDCGVAPDGSSTCAGHAVRAFMPGQTVCGTLSGTSGIASSGCQPDTRGPEDVLSFHLATAGGVTLAVQAAIDTVLTVRNGCPPAGTELACNEQQGGALAPAIRASLPAGDYDVVVDQFGASGVGGPYDLVTGVYAPASNATCTTATLLTSGTPAMGTIGAGDSTSRACRTTDAGSELFYRVQIPSSQTATIVATPTGPSWRPFLHAMDACGATPSCLADAMAAGAGMPAMLTVHNSGTSVRDVVIVVAAPTEPVDALSGFTLLATVM